MTEIVRLDDAQSSRAVDTLVQAFRADPMYAYICPDEADRVRSMRGLWKAVLRVTLAYGEAWTTAEVSGVACWGRQATRRSVCGTWCARDLHWRAR